MIDEYSDKHRRLTITITAWVYHKDDPEEKIEEFTKTYTEEESGPFTNTREEWVYDKNEVILRRLTEGAIQIFGKYGITGEANGHQESISFNWTFEIISADDKYTPGIPIELAIEEIIIETLEKIAPEILDRLPDSAKKRIKRLEREKKKRIDATKEDIENIDNTIKEILETNIK